ncbi:MAG TPA: AsmA family protein [Oxalicibacterium sp.]|uniref:AsmA family protein n=1 Tax=Oxalicibacterium sp. TaxID=2766525 RepID=UPI002C35AEFD|nr:AsmA family protein [Oxalicibacterium sp.]HWU99327.1 AsmA family protein [Oxalicibacterium sp.]
MSRTQKIIMWSTLGLLAIPILCIVFLLTFDWNRARPWINERVSDATGRVFEIRGDLNLDWKRAAEEDGWHAWIPWPRPSASDIVLSNPDWARTGPQMVTLKQVAFSINPWPLLAKKVVLHELDVDGLALGLERTTDGKNNWTFKKNDDEPSAWAVEFGKLVIRQAALRYLDPNIKLDLKATAQTLNDNNPKGYGLQFTAGGSYNNAPITGGGKTGGILSLKEKGTVFPVQANVHIGKNIIGVEGNVTQPTAVTAIDLHLTLAGPSMANLYPLTGVLLPDTPPYATKGHLIGHLNADGSNWKYEKFTGKVGESDLAGTLEYIVQKPRPLLRGEMVSNQLRLEDLGAVVKADSNAEKKNRDAKAVQPDAKALPVEQFTTDKWDALDADVKFTGRKIVRDAALPIDDLVTEIHMKDKVLTLTPLNFGVAGGNLTSNITLNGQSNVIQAQIKTAARHLKIKQLFPTLESMQASLGEVNADASLSGTGNSIAAMVGSANGEVKGAVTEGSVSKFILEAAGLNVPNAVFAKLFGDKQVQLNCLAADFDVKSGLMQTEYFVMDTDDAVVVVDGTINLSTEAMNLDVRPKTKGLRIISLRSPLYVKGTFKNPDIGLYKGALVAKAGGAIALGVLAPLAAVVPLINPGRTEAIDCAKLLADYREKPKAPPPGQKKVD